MWSNKRETNLIKFLNVFAFVVKTSKFLLNTNELFQFRHFNEIRDQLNDDNDVNFENEALTENDW